MQLDPSAYRQKTPPWRSTSIWTRPSPRSKKTSLMRRVSSVSSSKTSLTWVLCMSGDCSVSVQTPCTRAHSCGIDSYSWKQMTGFTKVKTRSCAAWSPNRRLSSKNSRHNARSYSLSTRSIKSSSCVRLKSRTKRPFWTKSRSSTARRSI